MSSNKCLCLLCGLWIVFSGGTAVKGESDKELKSQCLATMKKAAQYMVEQVSTNGGYVWNYLPDFSRRWGEMEAYKTMIWVQPPGTPTMGNLFLDAYHATGDEYYYQAAKKTADALIWGQLECGGWHYIIDFAGNTSLKKWHQTIGKNGWRLEEFQHYYGNATFDDSATSEASRFLLRMYIEKFNPAYKYPLDKAINFVIESQYPIGGWPQRYPLMYEFSHHGREDYSSYLTFNDNVTGGNINFLIQCYIVLGQRRCLEPAVRGMNFYLVSQQAKPQAGWAQQYTMDLKPAGARTYEPKALSTKDTVDNINQLITFYRMTGDGKFLDHIPDALDWLDKCKLDKSQTADGRYLYPRFLEIGTNKPIYVHRKGSNAAYGYYYTDYNDDKLLAHSAGKIYIDVNRIRKEFEQVKKMSVEEATKNSPVLNEQFTQDGSPQKYYSLTGSMDDLFEANVDYKRPNMEQVKYVIKELDDKGRWLSRHSVKSNPYIGDSTKTEATDEHASTRVGDKTDTSPYKDESGQDYISTETFINNMKILLDYIK
ncbi:MAG: pectate lyase [Phycisphaerae bacterium]|jgi:PelA/Pel-15E family pectate lyase